MKKKPDGAITLTPLMQRLFVASVLLGWLIQSIVLLHNLMRGFTGAGTWTFQATIWAQPIVFFVIGFLFAVRRYSDWHRRSFLAMLLTVVGMSINAALIALDGYLYINYYSKAHPLVGNSYWAAFGNDWIVMFASIVLFGGLLFWLHRRKA